MSEQHGRFVWYELLTTDTEAAQDFYGRVVGWTARDASEPGLPYTILAAAGSPAAGLTPIPPEEGRRMGAAPRWVSYVAVDDIDAAAERVRQLGGRVHVPPIDSSNGRISIIVDPQGAMIALVGNLKSAQQPSLGPDDLGRAGWHELFAGDRAKAFAFYRDIFGWEKVSSEQGAMEGYQLFAAGGRTMGGMFTKLPQVPFPFWLYYFNVGDLTAALGRVKAAGGQVFHGPFDLPRNISIARCIDPQGAMFALQGPTTAPAGDAAGLEIGWSTQWGGISSKGRLVDPTPRRKR